RDDPWLIGYFVDNELAWGLGTATDPQLRYGPAVATLRLGSASPAKRAFVAQLREKYREIENLAAQWAITANSWAGLAEETLVLSASGPAVIEDLQAFNRLFAEAYFRIVAEAI